MPCPSNYLVSNYLVSPFHHFMTTKQRREYKKENQTRKSIILHKARTSDIQERGYWANMGTIQDGKYTPKKT